MMKAVCELIGTKEVKQKETDESETEFIIVPGCCIELYVSCKHMNM